MRLATSPLTTGSSAVVNTTAIAQVAASSARTPSVLPPTYNDLDPAGDEVGRDRGRPVILGQCPAIFDCKITAFHESGFAGAWRKILDSNAHAGRAPAYAAAAEVPSQPVGQ